MKNVVTKLIIIVCLLGIVSMTSCKKWLLAPSPGVTKLEDFFTSKETAIQSVNAAYVPLSWEYNTTYFPLWFIGDVVSDDALKGGQGITDMGAIYDMENFKTQANNPFLLDFYRAQYQGVTRCNLVLSQVPEIDTSSDFSISLKNRLIGEAKFLRAMYYFRLVRVFGDVPKVDFVIESAKKWHQPVAPADSIYSLIIHDLEDAAGKLWEKSAYDEEDLGRATKGAARALLLKVYLTIHDFSKAETWGQKIVDAAKNDNEYRLVTHYKDNFTLAGENGPESVFEIQYKDDPTSDYGEGNGFTRGNFTVIMTRGRTPELGGGWGFNKPTTDLYNAYETGDPRREATILVPSQPVTPEQIYLGDSMVSKKYAMLTDGPGNTIFSLSHASRGPINKKIIRYAGVLLMYAEACNENNHLADAKWALNKVRERARDGNASILPDFPYGTYSDNKDDLRKAIRHERRVELAMEGHRWFDLVRWGVAKEVMDAYKASAPKEVSDHMGTFIEGKDEIFPLPEEEVKLGDLK